MGRQAKPVTGEDLRLLSKAFTDALSGMADSLRTEIRSDFKADFMRLAVEVEKRATRVELHEGLAAVNSKLNHMMGVMDRLAGELFDNKQSHTIFGAMFGDNRRALEGHERRITALEGRPSPPTP